MRRIIIAAILTVISAVGLGTSFAVNDLPNFGEWMKTNEQQFRKPHRHDGPNMHMDQHMMDGNNHMMPQDGMGPNNGEHMRQSGQPTQSNGQGVPQGQAPQVGQPVVPNGQVPPQGQPPQGSQLNGNASEQAPNGETQAQ